MSGKIPDLRDYFGQYQSLVASTKGRQVSPWRMLQPILMNSLDGDYSGVWNGEGHKIRLEKLLNEMRWGIFLVGEAPRISLWSNVCLRGNTCTQTNLLLLLSNFGIFTNLDQICSQFGDLPNNFSLLALIKAGYRNF